MSSTPTGDIMTSNIIIAKFMGANIIKRNDEPAINSGSLIYAEYFRVTRFNRFHEDWNMLIPVVEKIESIDDWFVVITDHECRIENLNPKFGPFIHTSDTKLSAVYLASLEFIKHLTP